MFGYCASLLAPMLFLAFIPKAHQQECKPGERRVIMSSENDDITLKSGSYVVDYYPIINLKRMWNGRSVVRFDVRHDGDVVIRWSTHATVNVTAEEPGVIKSITITLHDFKESDSGDYVLYELLGDTTLQCWTLYVLRGEFDEYLEDGTFFNFTSFPSLSTETAARMSVTTSWLIGDREIDPGQPQLVERSMDNQNLTYRIHEQSNDTITFFVGIFKVAYIDSIVFDPPQDTYILAAKEALPTIRCYGNCSPGCNITWYRGPIIDSHTDVLSYAVVGPVEFVCYVKNPYTLKHLNKTLKVSRMGVISVDFDTKETFYVLKPGEKIPDIRCTAECLSTCHMTWSKDGAKITDAHVLTSRSSGASGEYTCLVHDSATESNQTKSIFIHYEEEASQIPVYLLSAIVGILAVTTVVLATCLCRHVTCRRKAADTDGDTVAMDDVTPDNSPAEQYQALHYPNSAENMYEGLGTEDQHADQQTETVDYENACVTMP